MPRSIARTASAAARASRGRSATGFGPARSTTPAVRWKPPATFRNVSISPTSSPWTKGITTVPPRPATVRWHALRPRRTTMPGRRSTVRRPKGSGATKRRVSNGSCAPPWPTCRELSATTAPWAPWPKSCCAGATPHGRCGVSALRSTTRRPTIRPSVRGATWRFCPRSSRRTASAMPVCARCTSR